ncbi:MAG: class F sortase [Rhodoglobus sp.]
MIARVSVVLVSVLLLAGCSSTGAPAQRLAPSSVPSQPPVVGSVPIQGSKPVAATVSIPPVRVQIPSVGIDVPVEPVGIDGDGLMEIPEDIRVAGWYKFGPDPQSQRGSTVISAHVDSFEQGLGPFAYLKELSDQAEIIVTTADGTIHRYLRESVQNVEKKQLPLDQVFDRAGAPRLVLITCGGQFDQSVLNYSDNVVVIANPA